MKGCQVSYTVIYTLYHLQLVHNSVKLSVLANCCLLIASIEEILDFLEKNSLEYKMDSTNFDNNISRNVFRNEKSFGQ